MIDSDGWKLTAGAAIVGALVLSLAFNSPQSTVAGKERIPEALPSFHLLREGGSGHGTITMQDRKTGVVVAEYTLDRRGQLHQSPEQAERGSLLPSLKRSYYFVDPSLDIGTWAGYWSRPAADEHAGPWQAGVRVSPVRLCYDVLAPDAVLSSDGIGLGVSAYPPASVGPVWDQFGLGLWYLAPFHGGGSGWAAGLSFSSRPAE